MPSRPMNPKAHRGTKTSSELVSSETIGRKSTRSHGSGDPCITLTGKVTPKCRKVRRNYVRQRSKSKKTKCNPAHGFQSGRFHCEKGQQCLLVGCSWKRLRRWGFHYGGRSRGLRQNHRLLCARFPHV